MLSPEILTRICTHNWMPAIVEMNPIVKLNSNLRHFLRAVFITLCDTLCFVKNWIRKKRDIRVGGSSYYILLNLKNLWCIQPLKTFSISVFNLSVVEELAQQ